MSLKYRVQRFWQDFMQVKSEVEEALISQNKEDIEKYCSYFNERLAQISGYSLNLSYVDDFYELAFVSQGDKNAQFATCLLKKLAPKQLSDDWMIHSVLPPASLNQELMMSNDLQRINGSDFIVYYTIDEASKSVMVALYCEKLASFDQNQKNRIAIDFLRYYLGELELEARISSIEILDNEDKDANNFAYLPNFYEDLCDIITDQDWQIYHDPLELYQVYKLDEKPIHDKLRNDILLLITTNAPLMQEVILNEEAMCLEFASHGGEYGYLYFEKQYDDEKEALLRQGLEKQINDLLFDMGIAKTMGGAIGINYSYIDIAIYDKDSFMIALEKINEKLSFPIYYCAFLHRH